MGLKGMMRHGWVRSRRRGFSLFETMVAMFVMLIGLLGIFSAFAAGMNARLMAQEMVMSQELATMWADWVRFRCRDSGGPGGLGVIATTDLSVGKQGNFYTASGDFHFGAGDPRELPTANKNAFSGYRWMITRSNRNFTPVYLAANGTDVVTWDKRSDNNSVLPGSMGDAPPSLTEVELTIYRGARSYKYTYVFSGVGLKYER